MNFLTDLSYEKPVNNTLGFGPLTVECWRRELARKYEIDNEGNAVLYLVCGGAYDQCIVLPREAIEMLMKYSTKFFVENAPAKFKYSFFKRISIGWHTRGKCWKFSFRRTRYHDSTHYVFWRFFLIVDDPIKEPELKVWTNGDYTYIAETAREAADMYLADEPDCKEFNIADWTEITEPFTVDLIKEGDNEVMRTPKEWIAYNGNKKGLLCTIYN